MKNLLHTNLSQLDAFILNCRSDHFNNRVIPWVNFWYCSFLSIGRYVLTPFKVDRFDPNMGKDYRI